MEQEKRKIIIYEIEQWRRSKLLPEHYCDFLMNLYDAKPADKDFSVLGVSKNAIQNSNWKVWLLGCVLSALIAYIVFHFNAFRFPLQIMSVVLVVGICYGFGFKYARKAPIIGYALVGLGSIALLGAGFYLLRLHDMNEPSIALAYVAFCSMIWIVIGLLARMGLFHYCGWSGLVLVYAYLLHERVELGWIGAQLSWLPLCVLFCWLGWLLHRASKSAGAVLLLVGFTLWWMPELYGMYTGEISGTLIQLLLLCKLITAAALLFGLRKKWIEWVF
ncbi:hypothetical protein [Paenibacillus ginsengarvi]|uniref:DUF2157 domain-containing protein n=1 Tax=Paenibacillus ginsengarvi TaxID=400777 RepID=A0A3B0CXD6_9BACL|nr:hypothetical protein [Paenibacillus ginsengarvi]RKN86947.1 hypothetical protein D7M11_03055 [Paenibacillus ginsengarvi]